MSYSAENVSKIIRGTSRIPDNINIYMDGKTPIKYKNLVILFKYAGMLIKVELCLIGISGRVESSEKYYIFWIFPDSPDIFV